MRGALVAGLLVAAACGDSHRDELSRNARFDCRDRTASYVVVGGIVQVFVQIPALRRGGFEIKPAFERRDESVRQVRRLMMPAIIGASVYQLSQLIGTLFASLIGTGSV